MWEHLDLVILIGCSKLLLISNGINIAGMTLLVVNYFDKTLMVVEGSTAMLLTKKCI